MLPINSESSLPSHMRWTAFTKGYSKVARSEALYSALREAEIFGPFQAAEIRTCKKGEQAVAGVSCTLTLALEGYCASQDDRSSLIGRTLELAQHNTLSGIDASPVFPLATFLGLVARVSVANTLGQTAAGPLG